MIFYVLCDIFIRVNAHGSLEDDFFVIRTPWLNKVIVVVVVYGVADVDASDNDPRENWNQ